MTANSDQINNNGVIGDGELGGVAKNFFVLSTRREMVIDIKRTLQQALICSQEREKHK
jgi:hypothetical protein